MDYNATTVEFMCQKHYEQLSLNRQNAKNGDDRSRGTAIEDLAREETEKEQRSMDGEEYINRKKTIVSQRQNHVGKQVLSNGRDSFFQSKLAKRADSDSEHRAIF